MTKVESVYDFRYFLLTLRSCTQDWTPLLLIFLCLLDLLVLLGIKYRAKFDSSPPVQAVLCIWDCILKITISHGEVLGKTISPYKWDLPWDTSSHEQRD